MEFRKKTKFNKYMLFGLVLVMSYVDCSMFYYGNNETLKIVSLAGIDETAVCNDGSEPLYYWKKSETGSNRWLIYLGGGGLCHDN